MSTTETSTAVVIATTMASPPSSAGDAIYIAAIIVQFVICTAGCVLNSFLAYVIAKNKQLRVNSCGLLIMLLAIFDAIAEFSLISLPTFLILTNNRISLGTCFFAQSYATFAQVNSQNLMLLISLDRLFTVLSPIDYVFVSKNSKRKLVGVSVSVVSLITFLYNLQITHVEPMEHPDKQVFCTTDDIIVGDDKVVYLFVNIGQISATFIIYLLIWILFKFNVVHKMQNESDRRVFKSLFILMAMMFFCYLPPQLLGMFVIPNLPIDPTFRTALYRFSRQIMKIAQTLNAAVLYFCSTEFRIAIRKELKCFKKVQEQPQIHVKRNNFITTTTTL